MGTQSKSLLNCCLKNINPVFSTFFLGPFVLFLWGETNQSRCNLGLFSPQTGTHRSFSTASQGLRKDNPVMVNLPGSPCDIRGRQAETWKANAGLGWYMLKNCSTTSANSRTLCPSGCSTEIPCSAGPLCCTSNQWNSFSLWISVRWQLCG